MASFWCMILYILYATCKCPLVLCCFNKLKLIDNACHTERFCSEVISGAVSNYDLYVLPLYRWTEEST